MQDMISIDTNIWIYALNSDDDRKQTIAQDLIKSYKGRIIIPFSVILEVGAVLKKKKISLHNISQNLEQLSHIATVIYPTSDTLPLAIQLQQEYQLSWFDSIIMSGVCHASCTILYSEDMAHNQQYQGVRVINPFL